MYYNTLYQPTRVHAVPNIPKRDHPKNATCPINTPKQEVKTLDIQLVSLRAISMYA
jgi:hypothetical protein